MHAALCIGINNYPGTQNDLQGCVNDAYDWASVLGSIGYTTSILTDSQATKDGMLSAMKAVLDKATRGDQVIITYSGHGSWVPDLNADEIEGRDECLCPYDINRGNYLIDDEIWTLFKAARLRGVRPVLISDSCHSGTVLTVEQQMDNDSAPNAKPRYLPPGAFLHHGLLQQVYELCHGGGVLSTSAALKTRAKGNYGVLMAGCKDDEYSYDAYINGRYNGAFTYNALKVLKSMLTSSLDFRTWYRNIKDLPSEDYPQTPQLGGSTEQIKWKVIPPKHSQAVAWALNFPPAQGDRVMSRANILAFLIALGQNIGPALEIIQRIMAEIQKLRDLFPKLPSAPSTASPGGLSMTASLEVSVLEEALEAQLLQNLEQSGVQSMRAVGAGGARGALGNVITFLMNNPQFVTFLIGLFRPQ